MTKIVEAQRQKYDVERNKRFAASTIGKAITFRDSPIAADLNRDLWVDYDAVAKKSPTLKGDSDTKFIILGGGHCGILFAQQLIAAGFSPSDLVIIDEAGGFGGTWYWNRYPGLTCDIEGYCYLPLLEETGYIPKHRYSKGDEIRQHVERVADKYGIRGMFCTKALGVDWDDQDKRWIVRLRRSLGSGHEHLNGDFTVRCQFLFPCGGLFCSPNAPDLPGFESFIKSRTVFHTARWDYAYTGGSPTKPDMVNLRDKVVGIIGTGATAVQAVPELAKWAKHLYVFQRTPSYCGPRDQIETTPELWARVANKPGWQYERMRNLNNFLNDDPEVRPADDLVNDGWSHSRSFAGIIGSPRAKYITPDKTEENLQQMLERDAERAAELREHISRTVQDRDTAEKLKPWYPGWCKRPTYHQDYLETFNRPNVTLVDTDGQGVQGYTERGVIVGTGDAAREFEVDLLVLATGFATTTAADGSPARALDIPIRGRRGRGLTDKWAAQDFGTVFGVTTNGFPNMFFHTGKGGTSSANLTYPYYVSAKLATQIVKEAFKRVSDTSKLVVEASKEAERGYTAETQKLAPWFAAIRFCTPSYFTSYKNATEYSASTRGQFIGWGAGTVEYEKATEQWANGGLDGIEVSA